MCTYLSHHTDATLTLKYTYVTLCQDTHTLYRKSKHLVDFLCTYDITQCTYIGDVEPGASPETLDQQSQHEELYVLGRIDQTLLSGAVELKVDWRKEAEYQ